MPGESVRFNRSLLAAAHDTAMAGVSFALAVYLRLGDDQIGMASDYLGLGTGLFMSICLIVFSSMHLYRGVWRYASMRDLTAIVKSVTLAILVFAVLMFLVTRLDRMPRSVFFINWLLLVSLLSGPRFVYRAIKDRTLSWRSTPHHETIRIPVLLIGANDHTERFIRDMARDWRALYEPVAIIDEHKKYRGRTIHDVPILSGGESLEGIVAAFERKGKRPQKLILTDEKSSGPAVRRLLDIGDALGIPLARLPKTSEFKMGLTDRLNIQPIAVEDLLGRSQNVRDREAMRALVAGKKILVSGAGGTIGGELCRQIASHKPASLTLVESSEFNLYQIEREMLGRFPELTLTAIIADVRDGNHLDHIFMGLKPEIVFHAAAIKHVPIAENNVEETVLTNVFGTKNLAELCVKHQASVMVMISTDKAVNPTNVMGAAKRLAESICQSLGQGQDKTRFITVRFGNVLGSAGSVVPLFTEQLAKGGPLTITHPDMTRYFMTVREAVELVLQAAALGISMKEARESLFVLDMGEPVKIVDLALQMIRLAGLKPDEDIKIAYTGLRPGEKLFEELFHSSENAVKTSHEGIFLASPRTSDAASLRKGLDSLLAASGARKESEVRRILKELVPELEPALNR